MVATIQQIIGKVNPKLYASNGEDLLKEFGSIDNIPAEKVKAKPLSEHKLVYDSNSETLEPIYFFILDLMGDFGLSTQKLVDNFATSPGSGHFSELSQKGQIMQQQASQMMANAGALIKSVLAIIYDLRDFRMRLQTYDDLKDAKKKEAAILSLKQIWLDKVDFGRGSSSIKMMVANAGFNTLINAFLVAKDSEDADKLDLNDVVKRIVKPRIAEFNTWVKQSEQELRKRYEIEKTYLRSQVNNLKLYSRWAKPYLKAAAQLSMKDFGKSPELVDVFNTILLELTLLGKSKVDVEKSALAGELPMDFRKLRIKRDYYSCVLVDFKFRGIPSRLPTQQSHYTFGGKAEVTFQAYALNSEELSKLDEELDKSDVGDVLNLIEGTTTESLDQLQKDIDYYLNEENIEDSEKKKSEDSSNPFLALFGKYEGGSKPKLKKESKKKGIKIISDNWEEKTHIRPLAKTTALANAFDLFDVYKKAHGMPSYT